MSKYEDSNNDVGKLRLAMLQAKYGHPFKVPPTSGADGSRCAECGQQHFLEDFEV